MAKKKLGDQKLYRNAGVTSLAFEGEEFEPGSEFRATLPPEQEMQLIQGGHIEILKDQSRDADLAQAENAEGGEVVSESDASTRSAKRRR